MPQRKSEMVKRLQVITSIVKYPDEPFYVEVVRRTNLDRFEGALKSTHSPRRFVYVLDALMPDQHQTLLKEGVDMLWGDELGLLVVEADELPGLLERSTE